MGDRSHRCWRGGSSNSLGDGGSARIVRGNEDREESGDEEQNSLGVHIGRWDSNETQPRLADEEKKMTLSSF